MSSLQDRLMADLRDALRSRDTRRKDAIRLVRAAIVNAEIAWQREASDEDIIRLIRQDVKRRTEAIEMFRLGGREDLVAEDEAGIEILDQYLPKQLSPQEIEQVVREIASGLGATGPEQLGPVMRQAMDQLKGTADGRLVNRIARAILAGEPLSS